MTRYRNLIRFVGLLGFGLGGFVLWSMQQALQLELEKKGGPSAASHGPGQTNPDHLPSTAPAAQAVERFLGPGRSQRATLPDLDGDGQPELLAYRMNGGSGKRPVVSQLVVLSPGGFGWQALLNTADASHWRTPAAQAEILRAQLKLRPNDDVAGILAGIPAFRLDGSDPRRLVLEPRLGGVYPLRLEFAWNPMTVRYELTTDKVSQARSKDPRDRSRSPAPKDKAL